MSDPAVPKTTGARTTVLSVDAMGGDSGPADVVAGIAAVASREPDLKFIIHGDSKQIAPLLDDAGLDGERCHLEHKDGVVTMEAQPAWVVRNGRSTSMWSAIEAVRTGRAQAAVSCGNTGALMALSVVRLGTVSNVNRPAIACLWPTKQAEKFTIMLDVGADIRAEAEDLLQYALMGASYARAGLGVDHPRVGLLNVGTEDHKGRPELKEAADLIGLASAAGDYRAIGFVEGSDLASDAVDVVVTDGFTGNIALKTGEGTAALIRNLLQEALGQSGLSRLAAAAIAAPLRRLSERIDPRRVNGGVLLGLNGTVVKSHGAADATGVDAAITLAARLAAIGFADDLNARIAAAKTAIAAGSPLEGQES